MSCLKTAVEIAQWHSSIEKQHQAMQYNKCTKGTHLSSGDRVLVANKGERGKRKLADKWEDGVYTVVDVRPDIHVYKIQDGAGRIRVVHGNLLLEVNFVLLLETANDGPPGSCESSIASDDSLQGDCSSGSHIHSLPVRI